MKEDFVLESSERFVSLDILQNDLIETYNGLVEADARMWNLMLGLKSLKMKLLI
ncbi:MAG: hypothetical protein VZR10_07420 [Methanobrevibacter sp.]|nr:hypothetical protein [Methanobrevibacter sp.]